MIKNFLYTLPFLSLFLPHIAEASMWSWFWSRGNNTQLWSSGDQNLIVVNGEVIHSSQKNQLNWHGQKVTWEHSSKYTTQRSTIDLSDANGPFSIDHIGGNVTIKEGIPPRLEIEKRLTSKSLEDIEAEVTKGKNYTSISTIVKSNTITGDGVDYTLHVPATATISKVSTLLGAISVSFRGILQQAIAHNNSISIEGCCGDLVNLYNYNSPIIANNIQGNISAETANGPITLNNISGSIDATSMNGSINISAVSGDATVKTMNGRIELNTIKGTARASGMNTNIDAKNIGYLATADTLNGTINLSNIAKLGSYGTINGRVFLDGKKLKK